MDTVTIPNTQGQNVVVKAERVGADTQISVNIWPNRVFFADRWYGADGKAVGWEIRDDDHNIRVVAQSLYDAMDKFGQGVVQNLNRTEKN